MHRLHLILLALVAVFGLQACGTGSKATECISNADCEGVAVCTEEGTCDEVECLSSNDCDIFQYCDDDNECQDGCDEDADCLAGFSCDLETNECEEYGCRSTQLDCEYGQYCDQVTGTCYDDDRGLCQTCDIFSGGGCPGGDCYVSSTSGYCDIDFGGADCGVDQDCAIFDVDESATCWSDGDCPANSQCDFMDLNGDGFGDGYYCHTDYCFTSACFFTCDPSEGGEACPRGFQCVDFGDGSPPVCLGDCDFMTSGGYLD